MEQGIETWKNITSLGIKVSGCSLIAYMIFLMAVIDTKDLRQAIHKAVGKDKKQTLRYTLQTKHHNFRTDSFHSDGKAFGKALKFEYIKKTY